MIIISNDIHLVRGNHILREANLQVANLLAKRGVELHDGVHVFHSPPTRNQLAMLAANFLQRLFTKGTGRKDVTM